MTDVLEVLAKLPRQCAARHPTTDRPILLKRGVIGFWELAADFDVDAYNYHHNVSAAQKAAMEIGSHFGWDAPGADPDNV